tara:strand:+ start:4627 stop:5946 length:1320 start_codon:yes stop_codon:yes gene_type:complete
MPKHELAIPSATEIKKHVMTALARYWPKGQDSLSTLPVSLQTEVTLQLPLKLIEVHLPDWASTCSVNNALLIPQEIAPADKDWRKVDWWLCAFLLLEGWHERLWEQKHGPIHSYSARLKNWDERMWQHAWVNRIALFLRLWAAKTEGVPSEHLLGPLPKTEFLMTHDVDAIAKTGPIRIKQGVFNLVNAVRAAGTGNIQTAARKAVKAWRFVFSQDDWWTLDALLETEVRHQLHARYHFYADQRSKTVKQWLFDPGYDINNFRVRSFLSKLTNAGATIGLHPSFDSWQSPQLIQQQKANLETSSTQSCHSCRQHWLRFSWHDTWAAQEQAGIDNDTTLMFNDRPGFRNSAAVNWHPWNYAKGTANELTALPTIIMDSHFYDYHQYETSDQRHNAMLHWIAECQIVGGQAALLWHPHTLTEDYGWGEGFQHLVSIIPGAR